MAAAAGTGSGRHRASLIPSTASNSVVRNLDLPEALASSPHTAPSSFPWMVRNTWKGVVEGAWVTWKHWVCKEEEVDLYSHIPWALNSSIDPDNLRDT